jgi:hypothetical protein
MISTGYILVYNTGEYEDRRQTFLVFSENRNELKEIENQKNAEIMRLRERFTDTESFRNIYLDFVDEYRSKLIPGNNLEYLTAAQLNIFLEQFPIPEELEDLVFAVYETSEDDGEKEIGYIQVIDHEELFSYYSIRELQGL